MGFHLGFKKKGSITSCLFVCFFFSNKNIDQAGPQSIKLVLKSYSFLLKPYKPLSLLSFLSNTEAPLRSPKVPENTV